jgi:lysozyme family protein
MEDGKFTFAIEKTLEHEGGYVSRPDDSGGETNFGISKRSYPRLDIKHLTREQAIEIYKRDWWDRYQYERIDNPKIAAKVFDLAVNMGPRPAHRIVQRAIIRVSDNKISVDGVLGPLTIAAANSCDPLMLLSMIKILAVDYYAKLGKPQFLKGWSRRALS